MNSFILNFLPIFCMLLSLSSCSEKAEFYTVIGKSVNDCIYASGEIIPQDYFLIKSSKPTQILKVNVNEGESVQKGQVLVIMGTKEDTKFSEISEDQFTQSRKNSQSTSETLEDIKDRIVLAESRYKQDGKKAEVYRSLLLKQAVTKFETDEQYLKMENSRAEVISLQKQFVIKREELNNSSLEQEKNFVKSQQLLRSPISGKIFAVNKRSGDTSKADETIITVGKSNDFKLELLIDDRDISKVRLGQDVYFDSDIYQGRQFKARVTKIYPEVQKDTRSFKIDAKIIEQNLMLYPGSTIEANIIVDTKPKAIMIPKKFLLEGNFLRVEKAGLTNNIKVQTGKEMEGWVEITSGLSIGDQIVFNTK